MERENRYLVLKVEDIQEALTGDETEALIDIENTIIAFREKNGKRTNKQYVVVADDWPMYEETWGAIELWAMEKEKDHAS